MDTVTTGGCLAFDPDRFGERRQGARREREVADHGSNVLGTPGSGVSRVTKGFASRVKQPLDEGIEGEDLVGW